MTSIFINGPTIDPTNPWPDGTTVVYINDHYNPADMSLALKNKPVEKIIQSFFYLYPKNIEPITWAPVYLKALMSDLKCSTVEVETQACFNFMLYKRRWLRELAIQCIEEHSLTTPFYTLNFEGSTTPIKSFPDNHNTGNYIVDNWNNYLADNVFLPTAVSLIIETLEPQWGSCMTYTEKTMYPIMALTLPIWLGGYQQAQGFKELGFDTFDDVINHSYQYIENPQESISRAIKDNYRLLTDLEHAKEIRRRVMPRLIDNRNYAMSNPFDQMITQRINQTYPDFDQRLRRFIRLK